MSPHALTPRRMLAIVITLAALATLYYTVRPPYGPIQVLSIGPLDDHAPLVAPVWTTHLYNTSYFTDDVIFHVTSAVYDQGTIYMRSSASTSRLPERIRLYSNNKPYDVPIRVTETLPMCAMHSDKPLIVYAIYIPKNIAEIVFQTLEPLVRSLLRLGLADEKQDVINTDRYSLALVGKKSDYNGSMYDLPIQLLAPFIPRNGLMYLDDISGPVCLTNALFISNDVHYIYRFTEPQHDTATREYADTVPAVYRKVWQLLVRVVRTHFLPNYASKQHLPTDPYNVTVLVRSSGNITHYGAHRHFARSILNQGDVMRALTAIPRVRVRAVRIETYPLSEQMAIMSSTHVLIAVHGAGCIHSMFQPAGSVFVHIAPYLVEHDLFPRIALAMGHRVLEYRPPTIAHAVFYSHSFPEKCTDAIKASVVLPYLSNPQHAQTASNLQGVNGSTYAAYNDVILAHKYECQLNAYYWKQQDLWVDPAVLASMVQSVV